MTARLRLTPPAAERLLALVGVPTPWRARLTASRLTRLGPPSPARAEEEPDRELGRLGALTPTGVHPDLVDALAPFVRPEALVDVDLVVRRSGGHLRLHSWQRPTPHRVAALTTTRDDVELAWHARAEWPTELARWPAAVAAAPPEGPPITAPQQLLVATGTALRAGRGDLVDVLTQRHPAASALGPVHDCRARLRVVVTGPGRVHWVGWVLLADGWRELSAHQPDVRLSPVTPTCLGESVERLVNGVLP